MAGRLDLGPLGRHMLAFIEALSKISQNEIYIDLYYFEKYKFEGLSSSKLLNDFLKKKNIHIAKKEEKYDFGIFTDLLTLKYGDGTHKEFLSRNCAIKICYEVFDGSLPPLDWIDIINDNFDICLSPSQYISDSLERNGVAIPCFDLPCVVFNDDLLKKEVNGQKDIFRFGFIGGAEQRKNLLKVIEAFHAEFKNNKNVELYIHSSYSAEHDYVKLVQDVLKKYKKNCNISFNFEKHLSQTEMYDLIATFNAYVYPSKTTGYFTTPCEALSLGIPVIISDIPVHQELVRSFDYKDSVFFISSDIAEPMQHSYLGNKYLGAQYDCSVEEIAKQLRVAFDQNKKLMSNDLVKKRKQAMSAYSLDSLLPLYHTLVAPLQFISSKRSGLDKNGNFYCQDFSLLQKYKSLYPSLEYNYEKNLEIIPKKLEIHDQRTTKIIEDLCIEIEKKNYEMLAIVPITGNEKQKKMMVAINRYIKRYGITDLLIVLFYFLKICACFKRLFQWPKRMIKKLSRTQKKSIS